MTVNDRADGHYRSDTPGYPAVGSSSTGTDHVSTDIHTRRVGAGDSPQATSGGATSTSESSPADALDPGHITSDSQAGPAGVDPLAGGQDGSDAHTACAPGDPPSNQPPVSEPPTSKPPAPDGWLELRIWSEQLEDAMQARIAAVNRAERGGVDPVIYGTYIEALTAAEHVCELSMRRCYRRVVPPEIVAWQKAERGVGEKLTARLLGHLGDPCIATPHRWEGTGSKRKLMVGEPYQRTISQLWQYCGVGDPARKKHKGMTAEEAFALGNPTIKMLLHLHAEACVKAGSGRYREVYEKARASYDPTRLQEPDDTHAAAEVGWVKTHATECVRCGPSGKPAQPGSPWSKGHQHAAALRKVAKEILRDLWRVRHAAIRPPTTVCAAPRAIASAGNLSTPGHRSLDTQCVPAGGESERRAS